MIVMTARSEPSTDACNQGCCRLCICSGAKRHARLSDDRVAQASNLRMTQILSPNPQTWSMIPISRIKSCCPAVYGRHDPHGRCQFKVGHLGHSVACSLDYVAHCCATSHV